MHGEKHIQSSCTGQVVFVLLQSIDAANSTHVGIIAVGV
jgi:hypothetical protein